VVAASVALAQARLPVTTSTGVRMVVTVEPRQGKDVPLLAREDVMLFQDRDRMPVINWVSCQGDDAGLELFILIDDASDSSVASQFEDVRHFINSQPPSTAIGIGYMRNGMVDTVQSLTKDHVHAATALRLPMGSTTGTNPYVSLSDLIHHWPASSARREVLMVTPGVGAFELGNESIHNVFVDSAIADAQREGIVVYAIYALGTGHTGHSLWFNIWAQNYLAELAEETGGEAYSLGFGAPVSLAPYLSDLTGRLSHQYLLTFLAKPAGKGGLQSVRLTTEIPNADLVSARKFYVKAEP